MRTLHSSFMAALGEQRAFGAAGSTATARVLGAPADFTSDLDVLNYALTLEHLESAFYKLAATYSFGMDAFGNSIDAWLKAIGAHEDAHVVTLTGVITNMGGTPVAAATYDFGLTDAKSFLMAAAAIENLGVAAYDGAGRSIKDPGILGAAGGIVAVEARHASYLNLLTGTIPFPTAFETPQSKDDVLKTATPFIVQKS